MIPVNQERLIEHFCQLVRIDSESMNEKAIAEALAEQLGDMGFSVHKIGRAHVGTKREMIAGCMETRQQQSRHAPYFNRTSASHLEWL
ncbi:bifunctional tRNA (mnm(5)s(2)U34)-methyltransferase/FAD-dependent cmnm(5)s(2)U34 oxidoreductase [Vibrio vulnificus]|nr:bifunctional tRNA (mnm(5)s(2)U34)-methyltransferase/FAD-dependent cmnm(5)s(2)U34 oxidoreductase [Vibrio vulnificus]